MIKKSVKISLMKNLFLLLVILLLGLSVSAEGITLTGEARFDWVDMSQVQRDSTIEYYHDILFGEGSVNNYSKDEFKKEFEPFLRDENYKEHYMLAKDDVKETKDANICSFYYKKNILIIYALQYKDNPRNVFYYDPYGRLRYVDVISENYPNFPYNSKQYKSNGKLVSAIYFTSKDMQYMYEPDGEFKGLWYKEKMYDRHGKQTVIRTNW